MQLQVAAPFHPPRVPFFHSPSNTFYPTRTTFPPSRYSFSFPPISILFSIFVYLSFPRVFGSPMSPPRVPFSHLDSIPRSRLVAHTHTCTVLYIYIYTYVLYQALVFRVFVASYHLSFPRLFWGRRKERRKEGRGGVARCGRSISVSRIIYPLENNTINN